MSKVHARPQGATTPDPSTPRLDFNDPVARQAWLNRLREHVLDLLSIAEDATSPVEERMFSRHEAIRRLAEEEKILLAQLDVGDQGLPPAP